MRRCGGRYCLYNSLRVVNVVVNIFGLVIIIYSLWLLKKWIDGVAQLPSPSLLPRPWFINVCLGVGIVVCLITLSGHMVANCISKSILGVVSFNFQIAYALTYFHFSFAILPQREFTKTF